ncbi:MAG: beta-ketoacyl-ACP synthase III, partial [Alphaproteobacteria bacterium]
MNGGPSPALLRARITGCGAALPARIVDNEELARTVDTSDAWIRERTGIHQRHVAADGEMTSDLAVAAATAALAHAGVAADQVDAVILATTTPDQTFPATATTVQARLGMTRGFAFDIQAVCAGFIFALAQADNFIRLGQARTVLVIGAETFSRLVDWSDRATCVLFGDGAGAVLLQATAGDGGLEMPGIHSVHLHTDGRQAGLLHTDGGPSSTGTTGHVRMNGREVFRHAVRNLADAVDETLTHHGLAPSAIDWIVPHQANRRILEGTAQRLNLPLERVVMTIDHHANTSAASVPLALAEAVADGRIQPGHLLLLEAMG